MDWEKLIYAVAGVIPGGLLGYGIKQFEIRGKLVLNNFKFEVPYFDNGDNRVCLREFVLHIEFHNTSGRTYHLSDFKCEMHHKSGGAFYPVFIDYQLPPSLIIEPKKIVRETYRLVFDWDMLYDSDDLFCSDTDYIFASITYIQNRKEKSLNITQDEAHLIEKPGASRYLV